MVPKKHTQLQVAPRPVSAAVLTSEKLAERKGFGEFNSELKIDRRADVWLALRKLKISV